VGRIPQQTVLAISHRAAGGELLRRAQEPRRYIGPDLEVETVGASVEVEQRPAGAAPTARTAPTARAARGAPNAGRAVRCAQETPDRRVAADALKGAELSVRRDRGAREHGSETRRSEL